ncbi:MAG: hypothetical protein GQ538_00265 [Xanthomonadales bacterium]|nr:hypothetical protein [Xanthomonadales bacterium]
MQQKTNKTFRRRIGLLAALLVCLSPAFSAASDNVRATNSLGDARQTGDNQPLVLLPLQKTRQQSGLAFDLGGSDTRRLELQLSEPLKVNINSNSVKSSTGVGSVFLDSSVSLRLNDNLDITSSLGAGKSRAGFQSLGSIHCQNGVLEQGSYRASDCYFINQANVLKQDQVALGLRYSDDNLGAALSMFRHQSSLGQQGVLNYTAPITNPGLGGALLTPGYSSTLLSTNSGQSPNYLSGEVSGLDLDFQVGLTTNSAGDIRLGLQLTRVMDATYESSSAYTPGLQSWAIARPFDSATMSLDWSKGNFSGGIEGFYREQVQFLNRSELDSSTTFDVHFTWKAPWNANLSVGTNNLLNAGSEDSGKTDSGLQDPFESVYGRIPYVRYQQDL